ncbi:hypothetical protein GCM10028778_16710 [Barrientosiimonas marina]|uniref:Uncharacterized protein n=1 Tax=Lentibacillus kimchii TaxID=1542911 RepID=A0ABW2UX60_9BACI
MGLKSKSALLISAGAVAAFVLLVFVQKDSYSTEDVVDSLWDQYSIQSTQFDDDHTVMTVTVFDKGDKNKVKNYLADNLSEKDLEHYKLRVYEYSSNQKKFHENADKADLVDFNPDN